MCRHESARAGAVMREQTFWRRWHLRAPRGGALSPKSVLACDAVPREGVILMNKGGWSWKRQFGVTNAKRRVSRATGIPWTKSGRQRKVGAMFWKLFK